MHWQTYSAAALRLCQVFTQPLTKQNEVYKGVYALCQPVGGIFPIEHRAGGQALQPDGCNASRVIEPCSSGTAELKEVPLGAAGARLSVSSPTCQLFEGVGCSMDCLLVLGVQQLQQRRHSCDGAGGRIFFPVQGQRTGVRGFDLLCTTPALFQGVDIRCQPEA